MTDEQKLVVIGGAGGVIAMVAALLGLSGLMLGLDADAPAGERLAYAVQWIALAALPLLMSIESVAFGRFTSEAIDPAAQKESRGMTINGRVVDNTVQQYLLFIAAALAVAAGARGDELGLVAAGSIVFVVARLIFWIGYRIRPVHRSAGFGSTFYLSIVLFGYALWFALRE